MARCNHTLLRMPPSSQHELHHRFDRHSILPTMEFAYQASGIREDASASCRSSD